MGQEITEREQRLIKLCKEIINGYYDCANITIECLDQNWYGEKFLIKNYLGGEDGIKDDGWLQEAIAKTILEYYNKK